MSTATPKVIVCHGGPADGHELEFNDPPKSGENIHFHLRHDYLCAPSGSLISSGSLRPYTYRYNGDDEATYIN